MENQRAPVWQECRDCNVRRDQPQTVFLKLHIAKDVWAKRSRVRQHGRAESRMKFLGNRRAADLGAAFDDQRLESGMGQIEGCDQAIVTTTDDDDVARVRHLAMLCGFSSVKLRALCGKNQKL